MSQSIQIPLFQDVESSTPVPGIPLGVADNGRKKPISDLADEPWKFPDDGYRHPDARELIEANALVRRLSDARGPYA